MSDPQDVARDSRASRVLEFLRAGGEGRICCIYRSLQMSIQSANQALEQLKAAGLVRFDSVRTERGGWARQWHLTDSGGPRLSPPRTIVEQAIAAMPLLQRVWMEARA